MPALSDLMGYGSSSVLPEPPPPPPGPSLLDQLAGWAQQRVQQAGQMTQGPFHAPGGIDQAAGGASGLSSPMAMIGDAPGPLLQFLRAYRGTATGSNPSPFGWWTTDQEEAARYAAAAARRSGSGPVVSERQFNLQNPYQATAAEMIGANAGTLERLKAAGHDAMVREINTLPMKGQSGQSKRIWIFSGLEP